MVNRPPARREAGPIPGRATYQVRSGHQLAHRQNARPPAYYERTTGNEGRSAKISVAARRSKGPRVAVWDPRPNAIGL